jgi:hypothetical protein
LICEIAPLGQFPLTRDCSTVVSTPTVVAPFTTVVVRPEPEVTLAALVCTVPSGNLNPPAAL